MSTTTTTKPPQGEMQRGLKNRHLQLIAIGGAIGTGLFLGSGKLISVSGPSIIFVYMVIGFFVFFIMRALGELLLSNLWEHGGMFPMGASGFVLGFQMGIFSFIGVELVGTAAAETENPRKTLPKAINSIVARILIFYVGALIVIMSVTPWDKIEPGKSPFVSTLAIAGFGLAAFAIQLVVLSSAASSANSGLYSGSRMLFGLSKDGHAPKAFAMTSSRGVPTKAVFFTCVFLFSAIPLLFAGDEVIAAFTFVSSMCATLILFTWGSIVVSYIVYLRRYPEKHRASKFKMPLARVAPWLVLAFFVFIAGTLLYGDDTRLPFLAAPVWFLILTVLWQLQKRKLQRDGRPLTAPIPTIAHPLDEEE